MGTWKHSCTIGNLKTFVHIPPELWVSHAELNLSLFPQPYSQSCKSFLFFYMFSINHQHLCALRAPTFKPLRCRASLESPISFPKLSTALNDISNIDLKLSVMYSMGGFHNSNFLMDNRIKGSLLSCNAWEKELLIYPSSSFSILFCSFTQWGSHLLVSLALKYF